MKYRRKKPDPRWNRIWFFFLIVAVGLIFSWGQVGNRYQQQQAIDTREYLLLRTEADCNLQFSPCAAFAPDYALVTKLEYHSGWQSIHVKAAGKPLTDMSQVKFSFEPESSLYDAELLTARYQKDGVWFTDVQLPVQDKTVWKLRISVDKNERVLVADFPLPDRASILKSQKY